MTNLSFFPAALAAKQIIIPRVWARQSFADKLVTRLKFGDDFVRAGIVQFGNGILDDDKAGIINPYQRCGCSDSPFARKNTFLYCRIQKGVGSSGYAKGYGIRDQVGC